MSGAEILTEAYDLVTGPRQADYSHPAEDYRKVVTLFRTMTGIDMTASHGVMFMICVKMARIATNMQRGDWHHDSVVDAAGYLACLSMIHERNQELLAHLKEHSHDEY